MTKSDFCEYYGGLGMKSDALSFFSDLLFSDENSSFSALFAKEYPRLKKLFLDNANASLEELRNFSKQSGIDINTFLALFFLRVGFDIKSFYDEHNIPHQVFYDTLSELPITISVYFYTHGKYGLDEGQIHWLPLHITGKLFRLGRLQFEMMKFDRDLDFIGRDANVLMTHIPSNPKLLHEECLKSYAAAKEFFPKYLSYNIDAFVCESWLLSPVISDMLGPESNISKFSSDFNIFEFDENNTSSAVYFIFGGKTPSPQDTRLQIEAKKRLDAGRGLGVAYGIFLNK